MVSRIRATFTSNKCLLSIFDFNILEFLAALREELARIFQYIDLASEASSQSRVFKILAIGITCAARTTEPMVPY